MEKSSKICQFELVIWYFFSLSSVYWSDAGDAKEFLLSSNRFVDDQKYV